MFELKNNIFALLPVVATILMTIPSVISQNSHHCYKKTCLGCPPEAATQLGSSVACDPSNWVSPVWLHQLGHAPPPPSTASRIPIDYRCLKMVATPDDPTHGRTTDVVRGCVPAVQVDSVCTGLVSVERARGHSDARCFVCWGDNCNSAARGHISTALLLITAVMCWLR